MQSAHLTDEFVPGAQVKMIGIRQQNRHAEIVGQVALRESLDGGLGADRHEDRGFDGAVRRMQQACAGAGVRALGDDFKGDLGQLGA